MSTGPVDLSQSFEAPQDWGAAADLCEKVLDEYAAEVLADLAPDEAPSPGIGLHHGMPMAEYLAYPAMSASKLETLRRSPLQYRHALTAESARSDALDLGEAVHMALLEPERFEGAYKVLGACEQPLGKTSKRAGEPCGAQASFLHRDFGPLCGTHVKGCGEGLVTDATFLSADAYADVLGMRRSVQAHPRARTLFEGRGGFEVTGIFRDPASGVLCKIRPDRLIERAKMLVDLKTTRDGAPWAFPRDAENRGYFRKLALYARGLRTLSWECATVAVLAVESSAPYDLAPYLLDEDALTSADREVGQLLNQFRTCAETDTWPGYTTDLFLTLRRPAWATRDESED